MPRCCCRMCQSACSKRSLVLCPALLVVIILVTSATFRTYHGSISLTQVPRQFADLQDSTPRSVGRAAELPTPRPSPDVLRNKTTPKLSSKRFQAVFRQPLPPVAPVTSAVLEPVRPPSDRSATITQTTRGGYFELVVAWLCEPFEWILETQLTNRIPVTVYGKDPKCLPKLQDAVKARGIPPGTFHFKTLPNVGREGHSYIRHILDNYDSLAEYTAFAQGAGHHNGVYVQTAVQTFLRSNHTSSPVVPVVHTNANGYILYRDADAYDPKEMFNRLDRKTNQHVFQYFSHLDMANRARALYIALFGGSACDAPPMVFMAGAQFIVRRDMIRARSKAFWEYIYEKLVSCTVLGWDFERLWVHVFNASIPEPPRLSLPGYCTNQRVWKYWNCTRYKEQMGVLDMADMR